MNETAITRIIPKIHFRLLFFLLFLFFTGFFTFIALLEGINVAHLKVGDVKLEQLYLKWDNRLHIKASKIDLTALANDAEPFDITFFSRLPEWSHWTRLWIASVDIQEIRYDNTHLSLHYQTNHTGVLSLRHNGITYHGHFFLTPSKLDLTFGSDEASQDATINGDFRIFIPDQSIKGDLSIKLPRTPLISAKLYGNAHYLQFAITAESPLSSLEPIVTYLGVNEQTRPWITTYAQGKAFKLEKFIGHIRYDAQQPLLKQLYAKAHIQEAAYTFDPALAPIKAKRVDLIFQRGKLFITPHEGSFYALPTQKSRLYIDFLSQNTMLHAHIFTNQAKLNTPILSLLKHYDITVPLEQIKGTCHIDLKLDIDLDTYDTRAKGVFRPSSSELLLNDHIIHTQGGLVTLNTTKVVFRDFDARYKNMLYARVEGHYDATQESGNVKILPSRIVPTGNSNEIGLKTASSRPQINYVISAKGDRIDITPSEWTMYGDSVKIGGISAPYNYAQSSLSISKLPFSLKDQIRGSLAGTLGSEKIHLVLQMDQIDYKGIKLRRTPFTAQMIQDANGTRLSVQKPSLWEFGGQNVSLSPITAALSKGILIFKNIKINAERQFSAAISGRYTIENSSGDLILDHLIALNPKLSPYLDMIDGEKLLFKSSEKTFLIHSDHLRVDLETIAEGWKMNISDLSMLAKKSPILRQYEITNGRLNLYYFPKLGRYTFDGETNYPYKIMMVGDESFNKYRFSGSSQEGKSTIRINDRLMIQYADSIDVRANNMGLNVPELYRWISNQEHSADTGTSDSSSEIDKKIRLNVTNGYLYLMKNRKILADTLTAEMANDLIEGRLSYRQGGADFTIAHDLFYIEGNYFNDQFMEQLFAFSDFYGGELSFKAQGSSKAMSGIVKIDNTILKEYRLLNNVLSFVNTVPSLATFSLPNYNTRGLPVKEAYAHFTYQNSWINVDTFVLNSPEIKLVGNSKGNIANDTIDGEITLKTDLGSSLGKVPMVGYILFGDDGSLSTTLKISGKLSDPSVDTSIAKEVGIAPFNILKRTVTYPFLWMMKDEKKQ